MITLSPAPNVPLVTLPIGRVCPLSTVDADAGKPLRVVIPPSAAVSIHGGTFLDHDYMAPNRISDPGVAEFLRRVPCSLVVATGAGNPGSPTDPLAWRRQHGIEHFINELDRIMDVANAHGIRLTGVRMDEPLTKLIAKPGHPYLPGHKGHLFEADETDLAAEQVARFVLRARHYGLRVTLTECLWLMPWRMLEKALFALQMITPIDVLELDLNWWVRGGWRDNVVRLLGRTPAVERQRQRDVGMQLQQAEHWCDGVACVPIIGSPFIPQRILWEDPTPEQPVICRDDAEFVTSAQEQIGLVRRFIGEPGGWTIDSWEDGPNGGYPKTVPSMAGLLQVKELL